MEPAFVVEKSHPSVVTVRMTIDEVGQEHWFLVRSDAHHDNLQCNHALEREHLEQAKARGAGILDLGDLFCAMEGKWDKRADLSHQRKELQVADYTDALVRYCAAFYEPYAKNWVMLAPGNHEDSILHHHQTNLTERLAERLKAAGSPVQVSTYQGWVRLMFTVYGARRQTIRLRYTHGYGGGGPVTRDVIQTSRQMVYLGNADIIASGHTHDAWEVPIRREVLLDSGRPVLKDVEHLKCAGYKDEYSCGGGFAVRKGRPPKPLGAYWIRFYLDETKRANQKEGIRFEVIRAK